MEELIEQHGAPRYIRSDNEPEFIEKELGVWLADSGIKTIYIEPGSPCQNGFIGSFNGQLRAECQVREQLWALSEARVVLENWRWEYNHVRPHRSLGYISPLKFASKEPSEGLGSSRATPSLRPNLDLAVTIYLNLTSFRLS